MLESNQRGTYVLYFILALAILLLIVTEAAAPPIIALMLVGFMAFIALTARSGTPLSQRIAEQAARPPRITRAGQLASERVPRSVSILQDAYLIQDIGLIVDERQRGGISLRQARFMSLDDESVRPYVVIHYPQTGYARSVIMRFEMSDEEGTPQYIYEMDYTIRPGENLILPDYRLPLKTNDKISSAGTWNLILKVDGQDIGIHNFSLMPSTHQVLQVGNDGEIPREARLVMEEEAEERLPLSLEELLNQQSSS